VKVTGERVASPAGGFNPTWQRHVAAYGLTARFLPAGTVLDLGCGVGHSYHLLAPRETVGVDISAAALAGQERRTVVADMRELPFADSEFDAVLSVQSLEHVPDPDRVLAEVARVVKPAGTAVFVTPNRLTLGRPDEIIDPYHYVEFDADELGRLCSERFSEVEVMGLFGSRRYMEIFDEERATLDRTLARDPLRLRRFVPIAVKRRLYDVMLRRHRGDTDPRAKTIEPEDFRLESGDLAAALDVCAICRQPNT
jgi:SAM-dependent methyltransferase